MLRSEPVKISNPPCLSCSTNVRQTHTMTIASSGKENISTVHSQHIRAENRLLVLRLRFGGKLKLEHYFGCDYENNLMQFIKY